MRKLDRKKNEIEPQEFPKKKSILNSKTRKKSTKRGRNGRETIIIKEKTKEGKQDVLLHIF